MDGARFRFGRACIKIYGETSRLDDAVGMPFGATDDGLNAGDKLPFVEWFGEIVVSADA